MPFNGYVEDPEFSKIEGREVFMRFLENGSPRRFIRVEGNKMIPYSVWVWKKNHSWEYVPRGDEIHHKDFDCLNDHPSNLVKLSHEEHKALHIRRSRGEGIFSIGNRLAMSNAGSVVCGIRGNSRPEWLSAIYGGQTRPPVDLPGPQRFSNRDRLD